MNRSIRTASILGALALMVSGCGQDAASTVADPTIGLEALTARAKTEAMVVSVGMPDDWANWKDTWAGIQADYAIAHSDTDMSSGEEIAKFEAEKDKPTADIGDVGIAFGPVAVEKGVTQAYKTSYWDEIPGWAKDSEGHWIVGYQGTIAFLVDKSQVSVVPRSWADLKAGDYKVATGDVTKAAQAQNGVLACALAFGGDESNLDPALAYFGDLAAAKRLSLADVSIANLEKGELPVALLWDFNALGYRKKIDSGRFEVVIPSEGSVVSGYATIINKYAPHPYAAMLAREYILSDAGQINLAKGFARPIRSSVVLPPEVAADLVDPAQYVNVKPVKDFAVWQESSKNLPAAWQDRVLARME